MGHRQTAKRFVRLVMSFRSMVMPVTLVAMLFSWLVMPLGLLVMPVLLVATGF